MPVALTKIPAWAWYVTACAGAFGIEFLGRAFGREVSFPISLVAAGWTIVCALLAWRVTDEPAREAHKFAWWWGGGFGLLAALLGGLAVPFVSFASDQIAAFSLNAPRPTSLAFLAGILFVALVQTVGYAVVWAGWWFAKR